jgi:hypothetical protein
MYPNRQVGDIKLDCIQFEFMDGPRITQPYTELHTPK